MPQFPGRSHRCDRKSLCMLTDNWTVLSPGGPAFLWFGLLAFRYRGYACFLLPHEQSVSNSFPLFKEMEQSS